MANNTGNAPGSTHPKDLIDNAEDLDWFLVGDAYSYDNRLGRPCKSMKWIQDAALAIPAIDAAIRSEQQAGRSASEANRSEAARLGSEAARDAAQLSSGVFDSTALGLAGTVSGKYFSVPGAESSEYLILYKNNAGSALEVKRYPSTSIDSITVNSGKNMPMFSASRAGVVSPVSPTLNSVLLDVRVVGARPGKVYRVEWIGNGDVLSGAPRYEILFNEYDKATYATAPVATIVIGLNDIPATIAPIGGIVTRVFESTRIPGVSFSVTYVPAKLPAGSLALNTSGGNAFSWIIDESRYFRTPAAAVPEPAPVLDALLINAGRALPMRSAQRAGVTSSASGSLNNALLDVRVIGARPGKVYRVEYICNGVVLSGTVRYEILFSEYDKATYATAPVATVVIGLNDIPATSIEAGGIITRVFESTRIPWISFVVTYQPASIVGNELILNASGGNAFSWIIDESRYFRTPPASGSGPVTADEDLAGLAYSVGSDGSVIATFRLNDTHDMRLQVNRRGLNSLYDIYNISVAPHHDLAPTLDRSDWAVLAGSSTDWIGPYQVAVAAGGTAGAPKRFTGGAHGTNGDQTGSPTAEHVSAQIWVDGCDVRKEAVSSRATEIVVTWTNRVRAYNTQFGSNEARFALTETVSLRLRAGSVEVQNSILPLEDLILYTYYGLQAVPTGYTSSFHFVGGQQGARFTPDIAAPYSSGVFGSYPNVPALAARGDHGEFWMWLDDAYGLAAARNASSVDVALFYSGGKVYHTLVKSTGGTALASGVSKRWRGGYAWGANGAASANVDSALGYFDAGKKRYGVVNIAAGTSATKIVAKDTNRPASYSAGASGGDAYTAEIVEFTAAGYGMAKLSLD